MSRLLLRIRVALRSLFHRRHEDRDLVDELRFHLERDIEERVRTGTDRDRARVAALHDLGAIERSKEECRDLRPGTVAIETVGRACRDLRHAWRLFRRHPLSIGIAVIGLALAMAVVTAVFSIVNATLLRPYGMHDPSSVVQVARAGHPAWVGWSYPVFLGMREATTLAAVEAALPDRVRFGATSANVDVPDRPALFVSGGYLPALGARPLLGRLLGPADDVPGAPPVVVVSHHLWRTDLGGDAAVIGTTVSVNDTPATLVGVMDPSFTGPVNVPRALWTTLAAYDDFTGATPVSATTGPIVEVVGRLLPGVSMATAQANLAAIVEGSGASSTPRAGAALVLYDASTPVSGWIDADVYAGLAGAGGLAALILALACANAGNLLMASAVTRRREVGVRLALGATRRRLIAQMTTESLLLGLAAWGIGVVLAFWLVPIFGRLAEVPPGVELAPDARVMVITAMVGLLCGFGAGLFPARHGTRGRILVALHGAGATRSRDAMPSRLRRSFVGLQAAVAMFLLVVAALFARTAVVTSRLDIGFDADRLVGISFDAPRADFDEAGYIRSAVDAIRAVPAVEQVAVAETVPFGPSSGRERVTHDGRSFLLYVTHADAAWFATAGVRLVRGRTFTAEEVARAAPVAVISEQVARAFFPGRDPIGQSLTGVPGAGDAGTPATIVGVVAEATLHWMDAQDYGAIYRPVRADRANPAALLVRTSSPAVTARAIEAALRGLDARVRAQVLIVQARIDAWLDFKTRAAWMVAPGALLALALAVLGVFGVTTFVVGQRMDEVSVRMALGASSSDVLRLLAGDALRPVLVGVGAGLGAALVMGRVMARELGGISPHDPVSVGLALLLLAGTALLAVVVPARRAARTDPARLLRHG